MRILTCNLRIKIRQVITKEGGSFSSPFLLSFCKYSGSHNRDDGVGEFEGLNGLILRFAKRPGKMLCFRR